MGRTAGATNKNKNILSGDINKNIIPEIKYSDRDHEDIFLADSLRAYTFWKSEAAKLREQRQDTTMCDQYAEAHRLMLNRFTYIEQPIIQEEEA